MLGSFDEAEDLVQETLLRARYGRCSFARRSTFRAWLYAIATNTCLDHLRRGRRRALPYQLQLPGETGAPDYPDVAWLQPYPGALLEEADPESLMIAKETVSLAFLAAIQFLTPRQRAVLLLREVSGWTGPDALARLLTDTARFTMPPRAAWSEGRDAVVAYLRAWGDSTYRSFGFVVLGLSGAAISEITVFGYPELFPVSGFASTLP